MRTMNTLAAIDIGSNAIRLLISSLEPDSEGKKLRKVAFLRVPIRLGEDVFDGGTIGAAKEACLNEAMRGFSHIMRAFEVRKYQAYATSAMREAANGAEVLEVVKAESGIDVEIISGQKEADIISEAALLGGALERARNYLFVDVGGGSTELIVIAGGRKMAARSFRLGTVRALKDAVDPGEVSRCKCWLKEVRKEYPLLSLVASGGNINKIHKLLNKREGETLGYSDIKTLYDTLKPMSYEERIRSFKMNPYRADVIVPALKIYLTVSKLCRVQEIVVPKVGLVDAIQTLEIAGSASQF